MLCDSLYVIDGRRGAAMRYLGRLTWFTTSVFLIGVFLAAGAGRVDAQEKIGRAHV